MRWIVVSVFLLGLLSAPVWAGLEFEKANLELKAKPRDTQAEAVFRFVNKGVKSVEITQVQTSCDCTTATLSKKNYEPGESGGKPAFHLLPHRQFCSH